VALDPRNPLSFPLAIVYAIYLISDAASTAASIPEGTLTVERGPRDASGMLTVDLAKTAAETLQRHGARNVYLVDGYLRLPIADQSQSLDDAQFEERTRIIRWYNEDATRVDYSGLGLEGLDAILEVGIVDYQDFGSDVLLQVMVRLVDPVTKQVLGKARNWVGPSLVPLPLFLRSAPPEPREQRDKVTGQTLVTQCLKDLGLIAE
jgi:hypothetical protein